MKVNPSQGNGESPRWSFLHRGQPYKNMAEDSNPFKQSKQDLAPKKEPGKADQIQTDEPASAITDQSVIDKISTEDLFDIVRQRVMSDSAKALIIKAKQEYQELESRVGDNEARSLIGNLVSERILKQLGAAEANG